MSAKKKINRTALYLLIAVVLSSALLYGIYRTLVNFYYFEVVLVIYTVVSVGFITAYIIYNRGMSRRGVTADMLPDTWSNEEKQRFIDDGKNRQRKSRWMLVIIAAFVITVAIDATELFVLPFFKGLITR